MSRNFSSMLSSWSQIAITAMFVVALSACETPPEEKLEEAAEELEKAREATDERKEHISDIHDELNEKQSEVKQAENELAEARERLAAAQQRLQEARQHLDSRATDVALFRRIQSSLLNDEELSEAAVSVRVEERHVTLEGTVREEEERDRAIEIASAAPGVERVNDEITVRNGEKEAGDQPVQSAPTRVHQRPTPTVEQEVPQRTTNE